MRKGPSQLPQPADQPKLSLTALVVDGDGTSRRFAELALGRAGFVVETAKDAAGALETLKIERVDLIVCDTDLDDMDGLTLYRRLAAERRLRSIPFMFLSADRTPSTKVRALRAGVDDYLYKPCDVIELIARAESLVEKQRKLREQMSARSFCLAGELSVIPFADVIALLELTRRTGVLSLVTPSSSGQLFFENGMVVHAHCGNLLGMEAFMSLFGALIGHFEFTLESGPPEMRTMNTSATELILEAARISDTTLHDRPMELVEIPPPRTERFVRHLSKPPPARDPVVAARLEAALEDRFTLGDLQLWNPTRLSSWTESDEGRERFHIQLVADPTTAVSAMLALGGAPTERWVLDSLEKSRKAFGLTFFLRRDQIIDVLLIDAADPIAHLSSLHRTPAVMLICPPGGSLTGLGSSARVGMEHLIDALAPPAILGVGGEGLRNTLSEIASVKVGSSRLACVGGGLGDLRELLIAGIRFWGE